MTPTQHALDAMLEIIATAKAKEDNYYEGVVYAPYVEEILTRLAELEKAAEEMAGALEQYELTLKESAYDYEKMEGLFRKQGWMTARREADETCAYIRAILQARGKALVAYRKLKGE